MEQEKFDFIKPKVKKLKKESRQEEEFVFEFMDMLTAPIIVYGAWGDTLPKELVTNIQLGRLLQGMINKKDSKEEASVPEIIAYLMTASLEIPLSRDWTRIYLITAREYLKNFMKVDMPVSHFLSEESELADYEMDERRRLSEWIYETRRKALGQKMKANEKEKRDD